MHMTVHPLPFEDSAVCEVVRPIAVHFVPRELTLVGDRARRRQENTVAMLDAIQELALALRPVGPAVDTVTIFLVVGPLALVRAAVVMDVIAMPVCLVVRPLPPIDVPILRGERPVAMGLSIEEAALYDEPSCLVSTPTPWHSVPFHWPLYLVFSSISTSSFSTRSSSTPGASKTNVCGTSALSSHFDGALSQHCSPKKIISGKAASRPTGKTRSPG
eukprot:CAMPEP_0117510030 /NCGR_PEP_ID=MMETSP0784-20121206/27780_1 /TAXON_ID=39447 /ORGANISM="" /LENGTH=216 /DNA_ID=CAMNT_0005305655 /DNA_START=268 /DNA_END=915 /DNA_ORIENTATION=+